MAEYPELRGKVVIVTGATSGIGAAAAEMFAQAGAKVALAGRRTDRGTELARRLCSDGGEAMFVTTDVRDARSVAAMVASVVARYGALHCAFNNAGVGGENQKETAEHSEENWDDVVNTNLRGVWCCMKYELPHMKGAGGGAIVNSTSIYAHAGSDLGIAPYVASKHGVLGLTRAAALEYARHGVRINAVSPGMTLSEMTEPAMRAYPVQFEQTVRSSVPAGRLAQPREIAAAVLWLCSEAASFVTGESITVDGGWRVR